MHKKSTENLDLGHVAKKRMDHMHHMMKKSWFPNKVKCIQIKINDLMKNNFLFYT